MTKRTRAPRTVKTKARRRPALVSPKAEYKDKDAEESKPRPKKKPGFESSRSCLEKPLVRLLYVVPMMPRHHLISKIVRTPELHGKLIDRVALNECCLLRDRKKVIVI